MERFWSKVDTSGECWLWTAYRYPHGYGRFFFNGKNGLAHRAAYELLVGPIPEGLELDHLCRNHGCVNPDHLEPVTHRENLMRGTGVAARHAAKTHCVHGHPFDEANTRMRNGWRSCVGCQQERNDRQRDRKRARA